MNKDIKKKNIILSIVVLLIGLFVVGGTYAWLTGTLTVNNGNYTAMSDCFLIDYNINNSDNTQDITGTLFPTSNASKGLNGRVGLKVNSSCNTYGTGTIKLHVDNTTNSILTTPIASYCESKKTLQKIDGISTKETCTAANGIWRGYGDSYCENPNTLERIIEYTTQSDCESNGGSWTTGGSPLKYALYYNEYVLGTPISVGHISSSDIGHDITLKDDIVITDSQDYYYIYVWLDGYMTDNTFSNLSFSGSISASAIQNNEANANAYTVTFDANGGTVDIPSKTVVYGENYGTLPTPTRNGYTFLGWNGKNKFNINKLTNYSESSYTINVINNKIILSGTKYSCGTTKYLFQVAPNLIVGSNITLSFDTTSTSKWFYLSGSNIQWNSGTKKTITQEMLNSSLYIYNNGGLIDPKTIEISNIQLEDGSTATPYEPYYISSNTQVVQEMNHTLKAIWEKKETTFLSGEEFNIKIKQLANPTLGNITANTVDTNITGIVRSKTLPSNFSPTSSNIVSTSNSSYPIYIWYDNGIINYYTEVLNPLANSNCTKMFQNMSNLTNLDITTIDTSNVTSMQYMFSGLNSLSTLDLNNFNTKKVSNMLGMFEASGFTSLDLSLFDSSSLTTLNFLFSRDSNLRSITFGSNFTISNVSNVSYMFAACSNLSSLDISMFNLSKVTNVSNMLSNDSHLSELKTPNIFPNDSNVTITLPKTLYDSYNNAYTSLNSSAPTKTWLRTN